jgi:hypothetical protein
MGGTQTRYEQDQMERDRRQFEHDRKFGPPRPDGPGEFGYEARKKKQDEEQRKKLSGRGSVPVKEGEPFFKGGLGSGIPAPLRSGRQKPLTPEEETQVEKEYKEWLAKAHQTQSGMPEYSGSLSNR